ncbi:MAG: PAS domain-containing protein, partial [Campylobacterales bacterium]|nr:PAS domain-containing protein [Campylobacterales bacterium]
ELRSVVHGAIKDKTSKKSRFIRFDTNDKQYFVQIIVTPLLNFPDKELYLISFIEEKEEDVRVLNLNDDSVGTLQVQELEYELKTTKEHLQTVIEELGTSNEETQSLNEELQSSNEELETSNEELQSSNEELQTAYSELKHIHKELELKADELKKSYGIIKKDKDKLEKITHRYETAIDSVDGGVFEYHVSNRIKGFFNVTFANIFGYTKKEFSSHERDLHCFMKSSIVNEYIEAYNKGYSEFIKNKKVFDVVVKVQIKDKSYKYLHIYKKMVINEAKEKIVIGIIIDVTVEYKLSLQLELQKQRLHSIIEMNSNIIIVSNGQEMLDVNRAFEKYIGMSFADFKKSYSCICELFVDEDDETYLKSEFDTKKIWIQKLLKNDKDYKIKLATRENFAHFTINIAEIYLDEYEKGYVITLNDITQEINYQNRLKDEVERQLKEIRQKDEMLISQSKSAAMGEMISAIAHQWRQPLNTLALYNAKLIMKDDITYEEVEEFTQKSDKLIQQMSTTIDDFRDFFKPNKNKNYFTFLEAIKSCSNIISTQLKAHGIELRYDKDKDFMGIKQSLNKHL